METLSFDLCNFIGGLVTGVIGGSLITLKITKNDVKVDKDINVVDQSNSKAGGDVVGRDKNGN